VSQAWTGSERLVHAAAVSVISERLFVGRIAASASAATMFQSTAGS
jgi:hypothetical protein